MLPVYAVEDGWQAFLRRLRRLWGKLGERLLPGPQAGPQTKRSV